MIPVIWINSSSAPFLNEIMTKAKTHETRTKNMLRQLIGQRVIFAESSHGQRLAMCTAIIRSIHEIRSAVEWATARGSHRVPIGNRYDWKEDTSVKYMYELTDVQIITPFRVPDGVRHGRVWMEYENNKKLV